MELKVKKLLYNNIENPWDFIVKASAVYKEEFRKTSKTGNPPRIDDILSRMILEQESGNKKEKKK